MALFLNRINKRFKLNWTIGQVWQKLSEKSRGPIADILPNYFKFS